MTNLTQSLGEFVDAEMPEEAEERELREAAALTGATFRSVFGPTIYNKARSWLSQDARDYAWSSSERDAC